jgi:hypothetical protein
MELENNTEQQRAELPKHRPEPGKRYAISSSNGQRRKRQRQGLKPYFKPCGLPNTKRSCLQNFYKCTKPVALYFGRRIATGFALPIEIGEYYGNPTENSNSSAQDLERANSKREHWGLHPHSLYPSNAGG